MPYRGTNSSENANPKSIQIGDIFIWMDKVAFFSYANYDIGKFITLWERFKQNIFLFLDCYRYLVIVVNF